MQDLTAKRTLVKSPPELWEELSEVQRLAKHLGAFGEITITKLEPEHTVAWEGEHASGTVSIEPSGWGTKVILTAELTANGDLPELGADHAGETMGATEQAAGDRTELNATAEEVAADVAAADATTEEAAADASETAPTTDRDEEPSYAERGQADLMDETEPPVPEISPAAALAFDTAGAPATGTGGGPGTGGRTDGRRRRRGFWARLLAGWLVPEDRLNRAADEHVEEVVEEPLVELEGQSTESQPPPQSVALPPVSTTGTAGTEAERADRRADEEPESAERTPEAPPEEPESTPEEPEAPPAEPLAETSSAIDHEGARAVLEETLDALGSAHHRPYSRS